MNAMQVAPTNETALQGKAKIENFLPSRETVQFERFAKRNDSYNETTALRENVKPEASPLNFNERKAANIAKRTAKRKNAIRNGIETAKGKIFPTKNGLIPLGTPAPRKAVSLAENLPLAEKLARLLDSHEVKALPAVPMAERLETVEKITAYLMKRLEFPKYGTTVILSHADKDDCKGAGMLAAVQCGFFEHGNPQPLFKDIRNAINGRTCLRLQFSEVKAASVDKDTMAAAEMGLATEHEEFSSKLSKNQIAATREILRTLRAAKACDPSRKAGSAFKSHREFLFLTLSHITGKMARSITPENYDTRKSRFLDYLAKGAVQLRAERQPVNLGAEIMQALSDRFAKN